MEEIIRNLKVQIIESFNLEDITPEEIDTEAPLFGDGLGLDSIDALEIMIILEKHYNIRIADPKKAKEAFYSVKTLAEYVVANREEQ